MVFLKNLDIQEMNNTHYFIMNERIQMMELSMISNLISAQIIHLKEQEGMILFLSFFSYMFLLAEKIIEGAEKLKEICFQKKKNCFPKCGEEKWFF